MTNFYADLHIHTSYSDGVYTPEEIVEIASNSNLGVIAITDHDSVSGVNEAILYAGNKIEVIPAVEMSANIGSHDIHILGYCINHNDCAFNDYLEEFKQYRIVRTKKIIQNLARDGIKIEFEHVRQIAQNSTMGRPHIAEALLECGYVRNRNEAFHRYLGYHCPYYEPKKEVSPRTVIQKIKECGGIPVIAHPGMIGGDFGIIYQLIGDGVLGIEIWHPEHTKKQEDDFYEIAMKHGLLMTGGSDFHGFPRGYCQIGDYGCYDRNVKELKDFLNSKYF